MTMRFGGEQDSRLGSRASAGIEPAPLRTRYLRAVPPPPQPRLVAKVHRLAAIAADDTLDDDLLPPSPALRIKWRRVLSLALLAVLAFVGTITIGHAAASHWRGAWKATYITAAAGYLLYLTRRTDR
jgi:hypothetical protein